MKNNLQCWRTWREDEFNEVCVVHRCISADISDYVSYVHTFTVLRVQPISRRCPVGLRQASECRCASSTDMPTWVFHSSRLRSHPATCCVPFACDLPSPWTAKDTAWGQHCDRRSLGPLSVHHISPLNKMHTIRGQPSTMKVVEHITHWSRVLRYTRRNK